MLWRRRSTARRPPLGTMKTAWGEKKGLLFSASASPTPQKQPSGARIPSVYASFCLLPLQAKPIRRATTPDPFPFLQARNSPSACLPACLPPSPPGLRLKASRTPRRSYIQVLPRTAQRRRLLSAAGSPTAIIYARPPPSPRGLAAPNTQNTTQLPHSLLLDRGEITATWTK